MPKTNKGKTDYTPKTEESAVDVWKTRIGYAKDFAVKNFKKNAKRYRSMFKGDHFGNITGNKDFVVVNYIYSIAKSQIPQIYYQDPYLHVKAANKQYETNAPIVEDALNNEWREIKIKKSMKLIVLDERIMGFGVGKLGYYTETVKDYKNPNLETGYDYTEYIKNEYAYFVRCSTDDVIFDNESKTFPQMRWMACRYFIPLRDMKDKFNIGQDQLKDTSLFKSDYFSKSASYVINPEIKGEFERVEVWEIQDKIDNKFYWVTDGYDKFLNNVDDKYAFEGFNYKIFYVNPCPDELYPISDTGQLEKLNLELDTTRTQMMNHRRKSQRKILYEEDVFKNDTEFNNMLNNDDMQAVKIQAGTSGKIQLFNSSMPDTALYKIDEINKDDINQVSGSDSSQRGISGGVQKTAYETAIIDRNANMRNSERIDAMNDYCEEIAEDLLEIMQKFPSKDKEIFVEKRNSFLNYGKEDIKGDYVIKIGSCARPNDEQERQILQNLVPTLATLVNPTTQQPIADMAEVIKYVMEKFGVSSDKIAKMIPDRPITPPPMQPQPRTQQGMPQDFGMPTGAAVNNIPNSGTAQPPSLSQLIGSGV